MINNETVQFSVRVSNSVKQKLLKTADARDITCSYLIREILETWCENEEEEKLTNKDHILIKGIAETLYMLRGLTQPINPSLKDGAKQYANEMMDSFIKEQIFPE